MPEAQKQYSVISCPLSLAREQALYFSVKLYIEELPPPSNANKDDLHG